MPRTDSDGNELGGVLGGCDAPLGSYFGWNVTAAGFHQSQNCDYTGGYVPFATSKQERIQNGDPRLPLEERYGTHAGYVHAVQAAAMKAVAKGFLLQADADALVAATQASHVLNEALPRKSKAFRFRAAIMVIAAPSRTDKRLLVPEMLVGDPVLHRSAATHLLHG